MKIECTKNEWSKLHTFLTSGSDTEECYDYPNFTCKVIDSYNGDVFFDIEGKLIEENFEEKK
jgi:hypothetical protein